LVLPRLILHSQPCTPVVDGAKQQVPLLIAAAVGGVASAVLVVVFADKGEHPASKMVRCSMGFFVAIVWIMAIADEVVNVLQVRAVCFPVIEDPN
jgi:sodium/potassium/calcium exchanger 6